MRHVTICLEPLSAGAYIGLEDSESGPALTAVLVTVAALALVAAGLGAWPSGGLRRLLSRA